MHEFVDELMARMTLQEKIGQLNLQVAGDITTGSAQDTEVAGLVREGKLGGVFNLKGVEKIRALQDIAVKQNRLGIPLLVGMDVIHGYETIFPIPLGMSCSWDVDGVENAARIAAREASADGINWVYSPMVDIALDARWGRIAEGNGEDPYLGSVMAKAYVRGYQGDFSENSNVMACVKHYALYGAVEAGRDYNTVDMSRLRMHNQYFPPYKAAAEAGAGSFMSSFNLVDGQHATANRWLLTDVLRGLWQWDGFVVTDYGSIGEMANHGFGDLKHNATLALNAGTDMDMCSLAFIGTLEESVKEGKVSEEDIDRACRRILEAKYKLGLFADPYRYLDKKRRAVDIFTAENREAARKLATESFVLLKNEKLEMGNETPPGLPKGEVSAPLLPLKKEGKIALIGPLADNRANLAGTWCVAYTPERYKTIREVMTERVGSGRLTYAQGCNVARDAALQEAAEFGKSIPRVDDAQAKAEALRVAADADVIVCAMGECAEFSGESSSRASLQMPDVQRELLSELVGLGKPVVLLHFSGRPTVLTWEQQHVDAILNVWFPGSEAGEAICDVLFGDVAPSGKLTTTFPQAEGQLPIYYNHLNTGRPVAEGADRYFKYQSNYLDVRNDPLYPFGYGLSYTTFDYSAPSLSGNVVSTVVTNTGAMDADEVVQLYIRDLAASISRPVKELKGFRRIHLKAGESQTVSFDIKPEMLGFLDAEGRLVIEPGDFLIMTGPNSRDVKTVKYVLK
ncbi:MAG: beta-glucosidase BglX [Prevotella sp.]|nr:beta-glucosidase BglX [Prevotella sp.]